MASKLKQALDCSLDDYIAQKGIVSSLRTKSVEAPGANYFKRPIRSEVEDGEIDDDDLLIIEDRTGMEVEEVEDDDLPPLVSVGAGGSSESEAGQNGGTRPSNVSIQLNNDSECRTFITEEHKRGIKHLPSQQWRLRRENQVAKKPPGVPPLTTIKAVFDRNTEQLIASLGENAKFHNDDARDRITQRLQQNNGRQWNNKNNGNNRNRNNFQQQQHHRNNNGHNNRNNFQRNRNNFQQIWNRHNNNNRDQYGKNPNMMASFNPNVERMEHRNGIPMDHNQIRDLRSFITPPSSLQSQASAGSLIPNGGAGYRPPNNMGQQELVTFADMLSQISRSADNQNRDMFADTIRNMMRNQQQQQSSASMVPMMTPDNVSRMNSTELMPFAAQTVLNHISAIQQNFGPKYDMKVQKEIHALQGKSLLYRANGVVSMDGPGVSDDRIKPSTTDLSMNMRFT